jgi:hypothetical protein
MLLGRACTSVAIMLGVAAGVVVWTALEWRWYFALVVAWITIIFAGALLKLAFKSVTPEA